MTADLQEIRVACEGRFWTFLRTMYPTHSFGDCHKELADYLQFGKAKNKGVLFPRDHLKSTIAGGYAAWEITINPWIKIAYTSASDKLARAQIKAIQDILKSERHRALWPEMLDYGLNPQGEETHRPKGEWSQTAITVDHPERSARSVRDATVSAFTVKGSKTGQHVDLTIFDDLVTDENYKSQAESEAVLHCYTNMAKIASTNSRMVAVGTRYKPNDLYGVLKEQTYPIFEDGIIVRHEPLWDWLERVVEDSPHRDGTGTYLWPKRLNEQLGKTFGFDQQELAFKKAQNTVGGDPMLLELWYGQYYNDPNDPSLDKLSKDDFIYFDPRKLTQDSGNWYFDNKRLRLFAAADLAFSDGTGLNAKRRDYTAVAVIGIDEGGYIYILDLDRFQTGKLDVYYDRIIQLHEYWGFREITVETNNGGKIVKTYLEDEVRKQGSSLVVKGHAHTSHHGKKIERIEQTLMPRYSNKTIYHKKDGICKMLEEELVLARPPHDDLKDCLALCISESKPPMASRRNRQRSKSNVVQANSRFGGGRRRR